MANSIDFTAALKVSKQDNRSKQLTNFPSSSTEKTFNFRDSLKQAVRERGTDERKKDDSPAIRKDLVNRAESKLKNIKKTELNQSEADKPVEKDSEKQTNKAKKTLEQLLTKLEELTALQQQGDNTADKQVSLLEGIKEAIRDLETTNSSGSTATDQLELQSKTSELETKLEAMLMELKSKGAFVSKEASTEFANELKSLISDALAKSGSSSETAPTNKASEMAVNIKNNSNIETAAEQITAGNDINKEESAKQSEKNDGQISENKQASSTQEEQSIGTKQTAEGITATSKEKQPEVDEATEEVKTAVDSKIEKTAAEGKEGSKQEADAENNKETPKHVFKAVVTSQHKQVNEEMAAIKTEQAAGNVIEEVKNQIPAPKAEIINKADVINQIVKKAEVIVTDAKQEMRMQLEPENLGKLTLKLAVEKGLITAKFVAESQEVKQVIESNLNELRDMLQEKGLEVQNFSVSVGQENKGYNNENAMHQWKETVRLNGRNLSNSNYGGYQEGETAPVRTVNPYNIHNGKFDYRA